MKWRGLVALALLAGLVLAFAPAHAQTSTGQAAISVDHYYVITTYGFGVLNDSFTFTNPSNSSSATIPPVTVSIPNKVATRTLGVVLSPSNQFTVGSPVSSNGTTTLTITPDNPTLAAGGSENVALKAVLQNILNYSNGAFTNAGKTLVLISPGLNVNVSSMKSEIIVPTGGAFTQAPSGFVAPPSNSTTPAYTYTQTAIQPQPFAEYLNFTDTNEDAFTPITVNSLIRAIVPSANGVPMVEDTFSVYSLASYDIAQIHLYLLDPSLTQVTLIPNTTPPLIDPQITDLGSGQIAFADNSLSSELLPNSNASFTVEYALPSSYYTVSGNTVKITIPETPVIAAPVLNETVLLASAKGITISGQHEYTDLKVTPFSPGNVNLSYSVSFGWASGQVIPTGVFVFAVAFVAFTIQKPKSEEEEKKEEKGVRRVADVLNAFDEKTGLESQYMNELSEKAKGSVGKTDFDKMRNEIGDLRSRALQRLAEMRQDLGSGKQYDLLGKVADAEKAEDRAFRDILNLFQQYHGSRMNEETFRRLLPSYRKRVDGAINHLSDLLHETQTEEK